MATPNLQALVRAVGKAAAENELRWMQEAFQAGKVSTPVETMVDRRATGEPLQYILGTQPFGSLDLLVRPPTLIPRPETEAWTLHLAQKAEPSSTRSTPLRILDLFTGSGCIALLLLNTWPRGSAFAIGVEISPAAVQLARENARLSKLADRFQVIQGDLTQHINLRGRFDVITANPPYIPAKDYEKLPKSVKDWEDKAALRGSGIDGLGFYRRFLALARNLLEPGGQLAVEVGRGQAPMVKKMVKEAAFIHVKTWNDQWNVPRAIFAGRSPNL